MAKPIGKRVSFLISPEMAERVANIKRELYFDRPYSDLYRDLILREGHEALARRGAHRLRGPWLDGTAM